MEEGHTESDDRRGGAIITASWAGTAVLFAASVGAIAAELLVPVLVVVSVVLFGIGVVTFLMSYATALGRSRTEELAVASVYFLTTGAPGRVRRHLIGSFLAQVAIAITAASLRPYSGVAFAVLAPLYGLGLAGLWGARHGTFPPRSERRTVPRAPRGRGSRRG